MNANAKKYFQVDIIICYIRFERKHIQAHILL